MLGPQRIPSSNRTIQSPGEKRRGKNLIYGQDLPTTGLRPDPAVLDPQRRQRKNLASPISNAFAQFGQGLFNNA